MAAQKDANKPGELEHPSCAGHCHDGIRVKLREWRHRVKQNKTPPRGSRILHPFVLHWSNALGSGVLCVCHRSGHVHSVHGPFLSANVCSQVLLDDMNLKFQGKKRNQSFYFEQANQRCDKKTEISVIGESSCNVCACFSDVFCGINPHG